MSFIQLIVAESDTTHSGAPIRDKSNFEIMSTLWRSKGEGRVIALRIDKQTGLKSGSSIVASLNPIDIAQMLAECKRMPPDFILVEGVVLFQAVAALMQALPDVPIVIDMHNIESNLQAQIDRYKLPRLFQFLAPFVFMRDWRACLGFERQIIAIARQVWVCSDADASLAQRLFGKIAVAVVPNPIPDWTKTAIRDCGGAGKEVLFVGHLGYAPNKAAVAILCKKVMPRLRRLVPDACLHVCGRHPRRRISKLVRANGHRLSPNAPDMAPIYATAALVAIPLRNGGGTRLKVLEAMAIGCPVVATHKAVEGLGVAPQTHYHAAESPAEFVTAIAAVLTAPIAAQDMANRAQRFITERYGIEQRTAAVRAALIAAKLWVGQ
jgi:glycosyltransferase involved in cell wall biosynthesis